MNQPPRDPELRMAAGGVGDAAFFVGADGAPTLVQRRPRSRRHLPQPFHARRRLPDRHGDAAALVTAFDESVCLDDLVKRIRPVNDGRDYTGFDKRR